MKKIKSFVIYQKEPNNSKLIRSVWPSILYPYSDGWFSRWTFFKTKKNWLSLNEI